MAALNYILIFFAATVGVSGFINGAGDAYDDFGFTGLILPALALGAVLWISFRSPSPSSGRQRIGAHIFLWPAAMVLISRTLFTSGDLQDAYMGLLFVAVLLPALVRAEPVWIVTFVFTALAYPAQRIVERKAWADPAVDISFYMSLVEFCAVAFLVGLIPWFILRKRYETQEKDFNRTLEEVRNNAFTDAMARTRELAQETGALRKSTEQTSAAASIASGTLRMDTGGETIALQSGGGDEENVHMKSMLHFMRYNFNKAHAACAFTYDSSRRALILNSYDAKTSAPILEKAQIPFGAGVVGQVAADKQVFVSGDLSLYRGGSSHTYYSQDPGVYSMIAVPILAGDKELLGVLVVDSTNRNEFTDSHREQMRRFSTIASALIENIRKSHSLDMAAKTSALLYDISHEFSNALKMEEVFKVLANPDLIPKIIPSLTRLVVVMHNQENGVLRLELVAGEKAELQEGIEFSPESGGIYSYAFNRNTSVPIQDMQAQKSYRFVPEEPRNPTTRSLLVLPIIGGEDRKCVGLFSVESSVPDLFKAGFERTELGRTVTTIAENASVAIARAQMYQQMERLATTDGLTGLNNHRTFQNIMARELERARRYGRPLSLLLTDIDHFKSFNDKYGHPVGDLVLREIAGCIRGAMRINDFPARYGGEEFAVILPETAEQGAYVAAEKIRQAVEAKVIDNGPDKLRVTISIGCVTFPTYGTTQQEIIDCSDKALYTSKKTGRNKVTMYNPTMTVS